jgi:hypothetical protein
MTTLSQDLFYMQVRRHWHDAMVECITDLRRVCVVR